MSFTSWNLLRAIGRALCAAVLLCVFAAPILAQGGPTPVLKQAQKAYKEDKSKAALKLLAGLVKKYPDFQPARLLLGRIFFREGKISKAAKQWKRISPDSVPSDIAYEYGITMFQAKQYKKAVSGFAKVPKSSKYANYAYFYRGISYARLRAWDNAITWLKRARKLPSSLEGTRREALAEAKRAVRSERQGSGGFNNRNNNFSFTPTPPPPAYVDPGIIGAPADPDPKAAKKPPPKPPPPKTGFMNAITPSLTVQQTSSTNDYHGFAEDKSTTTSSTIKGSYKGKYLGDPNDAGAQPSFTLNLDLSQVAQSTAGTKTKFVAYQTDPGNILEQEQPLASTSANNAVVFLNPEGAFPFGSGLELAGGFSMQQTYPDFKADEMTATRGPFGSLGYDGESFDAKLKAKLADAIDKLGEVASSSTTFGVEASKSLESTRVDVSFFQTETELTVLPPPGFTGAAFGTTQTAGVAITKTFESFSLALNGGYAAATPPEGYIAAAADSTLNFGLSFTKTFEFGGSFGFAGGQTQVTGKKAQYDEIVDPKNPGATPTTPTAPADPANPTPVKKAIVPADGSETAATVSFKMSPLEWLFGQASFTYKTRSFAVAAPQYEFVFQQAQPEVSTEFSILAGVSKTF